MALTECIGLPMEPAFTGLDSRYSADAKHCAAQAVLSDGAHLIWTDDAEIPAAWSHPWALVIRPKSWGGLTRKDLAAIDEWCASVRIEEET